MYIFSFVTRERKVSTLNMFLYNTSKHIKDNFSFSHLKPILISKQHSICDSPQKMMLKHHKFVIPFDQAHFLKLIRKIV